jgi:serine/threonine protein kinase
VDDLGARLQDALGDDYAVETRLGSGGFAVVFLVRDLRLKRKLAVKVLSPELVASRAALERFRREAEIVAQLSHPNIVPLLFVGHKADLAYLVMGAIDGGTLADRLAREPMLPVTDVARIFAEVASALAYAHKRGVVHRDIKPQNVLLDIESGRALVTDFGIARTVDSSSLTTAGLIVGTAAYLSPEQASGEPSDHRADIYALGVMVYEMLAGSPPFTGLNPAAVLMKRLSGAPRPIKDLRPDTPDLLVELIDACLVTDPTQRLGDAGDIVRALTGHSPVSGSRTTATRLRVHGSRSRARSLFFGGIVLIAAAIPIVIALSNRGKAETPRGLPVPTVDSAMVLIPAGSYMIGSDDGPDASRPAHTVRLDSFGIGRHEVTIGEFRDFLRDGHDAIDWDARGDPELPATSVLLLEAARYCAWKHPDGGRLPTEAEWEAAARGPAQRIYPWGNSWDPTAANIAMPNGRIAAVGSSPRGRTPEGLEDMIGNVWEWTSSPFLTYGDSVRTGSGIYVIRGGAYNSYKEVATGFFRGRAREAADRKDLAFTGFRCAMPARSSQPAAAGKPRTR